MTARKAQADQSELTGKELAPTHFSKDELSAIDDFDAAIALAIGAYGDIVDAGDDILFGDGFKVATDKVKRNRLCDTPLLFLDWAFKESEFDPEREWVVAHVVQRLENGGVAKWVITDGGTGIARDLRAYTDKTGRDGGVLFNEGLRVSDYLTDAETGVPHSKQEEREYMIARKKTAPATTFYLNV